MNKYLLVFLVCCACTRSAYMTYEGYQGVTIGESIANVQVLVGRPYEVHEISPTQKEYVYIERIPLGEERELFRRYTLIVENGKVIDKRVKEESTPPIQFYG